MKFKEIYSLIPYSFRKKGMAVAASLFLRALLDFAGVAVFIPVLAQILEKEGTVETVLPVAAAAMAFIMVKSLIVLSLTKFRSKYVFSLYTCIADKVLKTFMGRGLLFIRQENSVDLANKVNAVTMTFTSGIILSFLNILSSTLLLIIILAALFIYVKKKMKNLGIAENQARRDQARSVFELFKGYPEYYVNGAVDRQLHVFRSNIDKVGSVRIYTESYSAMSSGFMEMTVMLSIIILMLLSMSASWGISMTFGIFALSAMKILPSVRGIVACWQAMQSSAYSVGVLKEILPDGSKTEENSLQSSSGPVSGLSFEREISLRSVSFRYDKSQDFLLKNFDLSIRKGEYVGIKGHSGIGKTTLFNLLLGFYQPEEGALYVDDVRIGPDNVGAWQALLGYGPQDVFLVNGTFVENVAFGMEPEMADREKIETIFRKTGLWDWVSSLPQGMDTRLAEAGNSISGGQRQRIGIARALYKGASVLFFDEATSSVDVKAEQEINRFVTELSEGDASLTVVVIAHRQETLASCRRVIDLDRQEIAAPSDPLPSQVKPQA